MTDDGPLMPRDTVAANRYDGLHAWLQERAEADARRAAVIAVFGAFTIRFSLSRLLRYKRTFGYPTEHNVVVTR